MDVFRQMEVALTAAGQDVVGKAKEVSAVAGLKSQIGTCEEVIKKNYAEIGRLYYENFGNNPEELFAKQCRAITNAKEGVKDLEQKIRTIKGI